MGKNRTIVLGAVLVATLLTGCGGQDAVLEQHAEAEATSSPETTEVPAFHFESGTLELGDFDPQTLGDDLFDPCTEISEEEFAAAGITGVAKTQSIGNFANGLAQGCRTDQPEPALTRMILSTRTDEADASSAPGYIFNIADSGVNGLFTFQDPAANPYMCVAQVDTVRGGVGVGITVSGLKKRKVEPCQRAIEEFESLFFTVNED